MLKQMTDGTAATEQEKQKKPTTVGGSTSGNVRMQSIQAHKLLHCRELLHMR